MPKHESMIVKDDIFDRFVKACTEVRKPNKALLDAVAFTKSWEQGAWPKIGWQPYKPSSPDAPHL